MSDETIYRIRKFTRPGVSAKGYKRTQTVTDERTGELLVSADLMGRVTFVQTEIIDSKKRVWQLKPNRKLMPSRWLLSGPDGILAVQFDQKILNKLINPLYRTALVVLDGKDQEICRLVDPRTSIPGRILGASPGDWVLVQGDQPLGKFIALPDLEENKPQGWRGKLARLLTPGDRGILSRGTEHCLAPAAALALSMLFDELRTAVD